jgi:prepilin-type N-terminal cleavage/methylation domain-containing protein/prepilin-type processing-associated H-X9-DG protein
MDDMRRLDARGSRSRGSRAWGFTLVELLVVIAIIGVLVALLLPAIQAARESARRSQCSNNLHQIGIGMINFHDSKKNFPPGEWKPAGISKDIPLAWSAWFLPYIEEQPLYELMDFKKDMRSSPNWKADLTGPTNTVIPTYLCPSAASHQRRRDITAFRIGDINDNGTFDNGSGEGMGAIDYMGMRGPDGNMINVATGTRYEDDRGILLSMNTNPCPGKAYDCFAKTVAIRNIPDGTSHTIIVGECSGRGVRDAKFTGGGEAKAKVSGAWASSDNLSNVDLPRSDYPSVPAINPPPEANWAFEELYSDHPGGAHVLMCDGSVHFLSEDMPAELYHALCTRNGEEVIGDEF